MKLSLEQKKHNRSAHVKCQAGLSRSEMQKRLRKRKDEQKLSTGEVQLVASGVGENIPLENLSGEQCSFSRSSEGVGLLKLDTSTFWIPKRQHINDGIKHI